MPRKSFTRQLKELNKKVKRMGKEVEDRIDQTIDALRTLDIEAAKNVVESDKQINQREYQIEKACMNLLSLQQPIAGDLRMVTSCLKIITDMERVADQCADICDIITIGKISEKGHSLEAVVNMLCEVKLMFLAAMEVFDKRDISKAVLVCDSDVKIDTLFSEIILDICTTLQKKTGEVMGEVDLMFITKYIERIGDHCTNISEWVVYMETGEHPKLHE